MSDVQKAHDTLGDEAFMSADDLRTYMERMAMAKASASVDAMDQAEKARHDLIRAMEKEVPLTPDLAAQIKQNLLSKLKTAAARGETEIMVMRFPNVICTDRGRAINNAEEDWPATLTGRPRQAYELWRDHLRPLDFKLSAAISEWPGGLPGDVGFFLSWGGKH
jgi:hypothetical protein